MTTAEMLMKCIPFLVLIGTGLSSLFTALTPAWREQSVNRWRIYLQVRRSMTQIDFDEKTAILLFSGVGTVFVLMGFAGLVCIAFGIAG
jgi:cytochrome c oxidase assembly factor CtaG